MRHNLLTNEILLCFYPSFLIVVLLTTISCNKGDSIIWSLNNTSEIGGYFPVIIGECQVETGKAFSALSFNGINDGLIIPANPIEGWKKFTVEVLFNPSVQGAPEQRFVHFQDKNGNRGLIEIRLQEGQWWLDTYMYVGKTDKGLTLVDRNQRHPCDRWYWAALVYDGKVMRHYLNADEELSGEINFGPMESGIISLGVRLNQVFWYKGKISEIRFHSKPLKKENLQKIEQ